MTISMIRFTKSENAWSGVVLKVRMGTFSRNSMDTLETFAGNRSMATRVRMPCSLQIARISSRLSRSLGLLPTKMISSTTFSSTICGMSEMVPSTVTPGLTMSSLIPHDVAEDLQAPVRVARDELPHFLGFVAAADDQDVSAPRHRLPVAPSLQRDRRHGRAQAKRPGRKQRERSAAG